MPYWALLIAALIGGFLALPAFAVARQSIAALAPESHRLPAFALDSITTELSFMAGPALGVLISTTAGPRVAMFTVGTGILISGIGLWLLNPPIRSKDEEPVSAGVRVPRKSWLKPRLLGVLAITSAATLVLSGTDVAVVAVLRATGEVEWTGAVLGTWAAFSLLGGFAYGTVKRGLTPLTLFAPMALLTVPVGLGGEHWWLLALLLLPAGALCAPTITATADAVSRMTPAAARGEAMGLHNSALTVGVALGAPLAGLVMDWQSPPWGFAAVGGVGVLVALLVLPAELRNRRADRAEQVGLASADDSASADNARRPRTRLTAAHTACTCADSPAASADSPDLRRHGLTSQTQASAGRRRWRSDQTPWARALAGPAGRAPFSGPLSASSQIWTLPNPKRPHTGPGRP